MYIAFSIAVNITHDYQCFVAQVCQLGVTICVLWCVLFNDFNPSMLSRDQILSLRLLKSELDEMRPKSKLYYGKIPVVSRNSIRFQDDMLYAGLPKEVTLD